MFSATVTNVLVSCYSPAPAAAPPAPLALPAPPAAELTNGVMKPVEMAVDSSAALFGAGGGGAALKSPINVLYENYSGLTFTCTFGDGSPLTAPQGEHALYNIYTACSIVV